MVAHLLAGLILASAMVQQRPSAPPPQSDVIAQQLSDLLTPTGVRIVPEAMSSSASMGTKELRIRWESKPTPLGQVVSASAASTSPGTFSISTQRRYAEARPNLRVLEVIPGRVLVASLDQNGRLRSWIVIPDPRILRSEGPGPDGTLTGQTILLPQADFFVSVPDDPEIVECRLYEPQPNGRTYKLVSIGSFAVGR